MSELRIDLVSKTGRFEFFSLLQENNVDFLILKGLPDAGIFETFRVIGALAPVATVLVAWLKKQRSRKIIVKLKDNNIVHIEATAFSADEIEKLLEQARSVAVIQTEKDEDDA